jgi:hypothetical protein
VPWEFRWVEYVRQNYHPDAVETAEQSQFVAAFA